MILFQGILLCALCLISTKLIDFIYHTTHRRRNNCQPPPHYPHRDPIWGLDFFFKTISSFKAGHYLRDKTALFRSFQGSKTFQTHFGGTTTYHTADPEVIKNYQSVYFKHFGIEPLRYHLAENLWGNGIVVSDGESWAASRALIRASFDVVHTANIERLEFHVSKFIGLLPRCGETVDLMPLFKRLILDTSSEFIFGQSLNALENPDVSFMHAFEFSQRGTGLRMMLGRLKFLHRDKEWFAACDTVTKFCDSRVDEAIERVKRGEERRTEKDRLRLVDEAAKISQDRYTLRSLILSVFSPAHDGAAVALSNIFFHLARNPRCWTKLREEALKDRNSPITYELLNSYTYLKNVFREAHRLTPIVTGNQRVCLSDVVLPCGGGPQGKSPLYFRKGDIIEADYRTLMRDAEYWGPDAEEFIPERWETARPTWEYTPFGGGPRACPGKRLVFTECAYTTVRMLREFRELHNRDAALEWTEEMRMTFQSKHGTLVGLVPE